VTRLQQPPKTLQFRQPCAPKVACLGWSRSRLKLEVMPKLYEIEVPLASKSETYRATYPLTQDSALTRLACLLALQTVQASHGNQRMPARCETVSEWFESCCMIFSSLCGTDLQTKLRAWGGLGP
jgi:hypothetical protein